MKFLLPLLIALSTLVFADLHDTLSKTDKVKTEYPVAVLETTQGTIEIELRPDYAPLAVENFSTHIKDGYYNGLIFHRIIKNFMIQGGDPTGTGRGGKSIWDKPFKDEFNPNVTFTKSGILAMANAGPGTNGSQFFITTAPTPWLNGRHTIFGYVVKGMDVIQKLNEIETTGRSGGDRPLEEQKIVKAYIK
ncbi:MAG: peptidylprolyl isomerase [Helicobacteraceae bacterium]|nr:peptidylprolyl isomerase [Helicobacteraceae bacterium]